MTARQQKSYKGRIICDASELCGSLRSETGLYLSAGSAYGSAGTQFLRMKIACPKGRMEDGLKRLKHGIEAYEQYAAESC